MVPKSSVFAVVALAAFMSLGALLFPQVVQAQECLFDCDGLGSGGSSNPWGNSPQDLDIAYCLDRACVLNLEDENGNKIYPANSNFIPTPQVKHDVSSNVCPASDTTVTIEGNVWALLRDKRTGHLDPGSGAWAYLKIVILNVSCFIPVTDPNERILSKFLILDPNVPAGQPRLDLVGANSKITIVHPIPPPWGPSCPTDPSSSDCTFALGVEELSNNNAVARDFPAVVRDPAVNSTAVGEFYRAVKSTRKVIVRDCKSDPIPTSGDPSTALGDTSTIACSVGGGEAEALFTFPGNWAGATGHTINPNGQNNPFDILTPLFGSINPDSVTASANNGPEVPTNAQGCFDQVNQNAERCFFSAQALLPNGCTNNEPVDVLVRGTLTIGTTEFRFESRDAPICSQ